MAPYHLKSKFRIAALVLSLVLLCSAMISAQASADWSAPLNLSASSVDTKDASIVRDSQGRIHVAWGEGGEIFHRFNAGAGWSSPSRVASGTSLHLAAGTAGRVYLAFANRFAGNDDIYFVSWQASGWGLPVNVSETAGSSSSPKIAAAPEGLAIVWSETAGDSNLIYIARSTDGLRWSSSPLPDAQGTHPAVALDSAGDPLVAWQDAFDIGFPLEIFFSRWTGGQWTLPLDISASPLANSLFPAIAVQQGDVYLAWQEAEESSQAIYLCRMRGGGWSLPGKRSGAGQAFAPQMAFDTSGNGRLVWTTVDAVRQRSWAPLTSVWQPIEDVALGQARATNAQVIAQDSAHIIWLADAATNNRDLYYSAQATAQPSPTPSRTPTGTGTATPTRSSTPTSTATPTRTGTATPTATATPTNSSTPTPTSTATPTATATPTNSSTPTPTNTATPTATATPTNSSTPTPTSTATATPTDTPTPIATASPTSTATPMDTATPTATATLTRSMFFPLILRGEQGL